jgi:hypothetical protein
MKSDSFSYEQLIQLTTVSATEQSLQKKESSSWLGQIGKFLSQVLLQQKYEPKVWERVDDKGNQYWEVYDPTTAQSGYFASEREIRSWLDKGAGYRY